MDATFLGWQKMMPGTPDVALYNVKKPGHMLDGSTVSAGTLAKHGLSFKPEVH